VKGGQTAEHAGRLALAGEPASGGHPRRGLHQFFGQHRIRQTAGDVVRRDQRGGGPDVIGVVADSFARLVRFADDPFQSSIAAAIGAPAPAPPTSAARRHASTAYMASATLARDRQSRRRLSVRPTAAAASRSSLDSAAASRNSSSQAARCAGAASPVCCASASVSASPSGP
jgi:hypothetical protein